MTDMPHGFVEYRPAKDGEAPPFWREGMAAYYEGYGPSFYSFTNAGEEYWVPREAVHGPDDALPQAAHNDIAHMVETMRQYPADELAKHGVTLEPVKDWAAEFWHDLMGFRDGKQAIEYLRTHCRPIGDV